MNKKEICEIKKRLRSDFQNISSICGCYVSEKKEIISRFDISTFDMTQDEKEKYFSIFRKSLSGQIGKNLVNLSFSTKAVVNDENYKLLAELRNSKLKVEDLLESFYDKVVNSINFDTNYVILLAYDAYDVPIKTKDQKVIENDSETVFRYFLTAICPVTMTKPQLTYVASEELFKNKGTDFVVGNPELGFMFPLFDERSTNLYGVLYYMRDSKNAFEEFTDGVLHMDAPMPAASQRDIFHSILQNSLADECSLKAVNAVQNCISDTILANKETHDPEQPVISKDGILEAMENAGINEEHRASFSVAYDSEFGTGTEIAANNISRGKKLEIKTPDIVIHINSERSDLVETKVIGENKYLMIKLDDTVSIDGVDLCIQNEK